MARPRKFVVLGLLCAVAGAAPALAAASPPDAGARSTTTATTTTTSTTPSATQVKQALKSAESSNQLWATINSCNANGNEAVGIRGQMPSLSFDSQLVMVVSTEQWSPTQHRYVAVKGSYLLGGKTFPPNSSVQEGITIKWSGGATVIGHITFKWFLNHKLLGSTMRATTPAHTGDAGTPKGFSVGTCTLP